MIKLLFHSLFIYLVFYAKSTISDVHILSEMHLVLGQNLGIKSKISIWRIIMNKSVYIQLLSNYVSLFQKLFEVVTDEPRFALLHNTWTIEDVPVGRHLVSFWSVNCKPVNWNFSEFLCKGRLCLSAHNPHKTRNCTKHRNHDQNSEEFSFSRRWPWAYFLNGPNAAASTAPTLIRHWICHAQIESHDCRKLSRNDTCKTTQISADITLQHLVYSFLAVTVTNPECQLLCH